MSKSPEDSLKPRIRAPETSRSSEPGGIWMLQLFGAFVGLCLGAGLLVLAVAVDVVRFRGTGRADICSSSNPECALFEGSPK